MKIKRPGPWTQGQPIQRGLQTTLSSLYNIDGANAGGPGAADLNGVAGPGTMDGVGSAINSAASNVGIAPLNSNQPPSPVALAASNLLSNLQQTADALSKLISTVKSSLDSSDTILAQIQNILQMIVDIINEVLAKTGLSDLLKSLLPPGLAARLLGMTGGGPLSMANVAGLLPDGLK